jgi:hypothetical protein
MYQNGVMKTWSSGSHGQVSTSLYMGKKPKSNLINAMYNRLINSRYLQKMWRYFQIRSDSKSIKCKEDAGIIQVNIPETWPNITLKTLTAIRYVHQHHAYDLLIRANASCYVNLYALKKYLESLHGQYVYAGPKAINKDFISGWGIVLNHKTVEALLDNEATKFLELFDDEAIGQMLKLSDIEPMPIPYLEISSLEELNVKTRKELAKFPFIRVKALNSGKRIDDVLMCRIHEILGV